MDGNITMKPLCKSIYADNKRGKKAPPNKRKFLTPRSLGLLSQRLSPQACVLPGCPYGERARPVHCQIIKSESYLLGPTLQTLNYALKKMKFIQIMCVCVHSFDGTRVLNSGCEVCKAGPLLLEPHFQLILLWLFWR
jgi:hypothetical protein